MIGYRIALIAAVAALSLTAAPAAAVYAVSDNDMVLEEIVEDVESDVSDPEIIEPDNISDQESESVSGNSVSVSDNSISADQEQQSGTDTADNESDEGIVTDQDYGISLLSDYDTYYGSISTTYVEYFRGYLSKLQPNEHYVAARTGQYEYIFAYGGDLAYDGTFYGSDVYVVKINTQNSGTFSGGIEPTFTLDPGSYLVYSDLSSAYPSLATSADISLRQIVFVAGVVIVFYTLTKMMQPGVVKSHSRRWKR